MRLKMAVYNSGCMNVYPLIFAKLIGKALNYDRTVKQVIKLAPCQQFQESFYGGGDASSRFLLFTTNRGGQNA